MCVREREQRERYFRLWSISKSRKSSWIGVELLVGRPQLVTLILWRFPLTFWLSVNRDSLFPAPQQCYICFWDCCITLRLSAESLLSSWGTSRQRHSQGWSLSVGLSFDCEGKKGGALAVGEEFPLFIMCFPWHSGVCDSYLKRESEQRLR